MRQAQSGFTLMELLVTLSVLAILASVAIPVAETTARRTRERELSLALREMRQAIDAYKRASDEGFIARQIDDSGYPPSLKALVEGVPNAKRPDHQALYFLRRIPRDPFVDPNQPPEHAWGLRSYASTAEKPEAGRDVFDVYSRNEGTGLNGIPYRQW